MRIFPIITVAIAVAVPLGGPASAQYRDDVPQTLPPPIKAPDPAMQVMARFAASYAAAGRPRVTILWNRAFSDALDTQYDDVTTVKSTVDRDAWREARRGGRSVEGGANSTASTEIRSGQRRVEDPSEARASLAERDDWAIEAAFTSRLQNVGIRLIDRAVAMRNEAAARGPEERRDAQTIEAQALSGKSDIVIEVLQSDDPQAEFGLRFRIEAKNIVTGELLTQFVDTGARPASASGRFVAGASGFVREQEPHATPASLGTALADRILAALSGHWAR